LNNKPLVTTIATTLAISFIAFAANPLPFVLRWGKLQRTDTDKSNGPKLQLLNGLPPWRTNWTL
jgi:hypothetical protein